MIRLNRIQRTVRNLLACVLLAGCLYAALGFPPYTVGGMCRRFQHDYLLGELEPLYILRKTQHFSNQTFGTRYTMVLARSGDTYVAFRYRGRFLECELDYWFGPEISEGAVCVARNGRIYAVGRFEGAASASAVVRAEKEPEPNGTVRVREFTMEGERLAEGVFAFPYEAWNSSAYWENQEGLPYDDRELNLFDIAKLWYREPVAELPCTVTLYDEAGGVVDVFRLSVGTQGIRSRH